MPTLVRHTPPARARLNQTKIRVAIVCPQRLYRAGLAKLLETEPDFQVLGEMNGDQAARIVLEMGADILLLDLLTTGGIDVIKELAARSAPVRTIVLSMPDKMTDVLEALSLGAWGFVLKDSPPAVLCRGIRAVIAGEAWVDRVTASRLLKSLHHQRRGDHRLPDSKARKLLTPRELEIVCEVADGASNADIAQKLGLSTQTVKNHMQLIFDKLGMSTRLELALYALANKLIAGIAEDLS